MSDGALTPTVFTADYSGQPGHRAFYLQARADETTHTLAVEKQQLAVLAEKLSELLLLIDATDPVAGLTPERNASLEAIFAESAWHVGAIGLSYDDDRDLITVDLREVSDEDIDEESFQAITEEASGQSLRLLLQRSQVRDFVMHVLAIVQEGRPICPLCGLPIDPDGHACPATNGHHPAA